MRIIGRELEQEVLRRCYESGRPEFLAVYGRRRVGKTFLIREYFSKDIVFTFTGSEKASMARQLSNFTELLRDHGVQVQGTVGDWYEAFRYLKKIISDADVSRKVVFIDELPWLATPKSEFVAALEFFWNSWGSAREDLLLIVCGSATSWIIDNVIHEHGGLYGRITRQLCLEPFSLSDCEAYFKNRGIELSRYQIAELYMVLGGIPYYLNYVDKGLSPAQCIDLMFFSKKAPLQREYRDLFASLFRNPQKHLIIIETLSTNSKGMTRDELIKKSCISSGGQLTKALEELEQCGFIEVTRDFMRPVREPLYQVVDFFTLFYLRYLKSGTVSDARFWQNKSHKGEQLSWYGLAFERLCRSHVLQIKQRLGIAGVSTDTCVWRSRKYNPGTQIDLVINREDNIINLCEMKFSASAYEIDKAYDARLRERKELFRRETETKKALHTTMVTTYGISRNAYYGEVQSEVTLDDLFLPLLPL